VVLLQIEQGHEDPPDELCTVSVVVPVTPLKAAEIVEVPDAMAVAKPALVMVPTEVFEEVHVTWLVMVWVPPPEYVPVAANCWVVFIGRIGLLGDTEMDVSAGTVTAAVPLMLPDDAVRVEVPVPTPVAKPAELTVATAVFEEVHVTDDEIFCVVPPWNVPVAVYCCVAPGRTVAVVGVTAIETRPDTLTVTPADGVSVFPLSSVARLLRVAVGPTLGVQT
jgi:hypothetical protein